HGRRPARARPGARRPRALPRDSPGGAPRARRAAAPLGRGAPAGVRAARLERAAGARGALARAPAALLRPAHRGARVRTARAHRGADGAGAARAERRARLEYVVTLLLVDRGRDVFGALREALLPPADWLRARYGPGAASRGA